MRLTRKKVEEIIKEILGEEGSPVIKELYHRQNISEFELATKTKKDIKVIRRMLYVLYNNNLVGFTRKKDKDKGWYIYYWTLLFENIRFLYYKKKRALLETMKRRLELEFKELYFICPGRCVRLTFDQGMDFEFHCPECGELINQDSSKEKIDTLKMEISELEQELALTITEEKKVRKKAVKRHQEAEKKGKSKKQTKSKKKKK